MCLSHVAAILNRTGYCGNGLPSLPGSTVDKLHGCFCLTFPFFAPPEETRPRTGQVTRTPSKAPSQQALCPVLVLPLLLFQHCESPQVQLGCRQAELDLCPARSREDKYTKLQAVFLDSGPSSFNFGELNLSHPGGPEGECDRSRLRRLFSRSLFSFPLRVLLFVV